MNLLRLWASDALFQLGRALHAFLGFGPCCRFQPTCSQYARQAVRERGMGMGLWLTLGRLLRCRPGGGHGWDPVS